MQKFWGILKCRLWQYKLSWWYTACCFWNVDEGFHVVEGLAELIHSDNGGINLCAQVKELSVTECLTIKNIHNLLKVFCNFLIHFLACFQHQKPPNLNTEIFPFPRKNIFLCIYYNFPSSPWYVVWARCTDVVTAALSDHFTLITTDIGYLGMNRFNQNLLYFFVNIHQFPMYCTTPLSSIFFSL